MAVMSRCNHMKILLIVLIASNCFGAHPNGDGLIPTITGQTTSVISTALSNINVTAAQSSIIRNHFKGDFGELHAERYLTKLLKETGKWQPVRFNLGRQGLDNVFVKVAVDGNIKDMIIADAKYKTSKLGKTQQGIQLGKTWNAKNIRNVAIAYKEVGNQIANGTMEIAKPPMNKHFVEARLQDGKAVRFWRKNSMDEWKFAGPKKLLADAQKAVRIRADYFEAAAAGRAKFRPRLYKLKLVDDGLLVTIKNASNIDALVHESKLPVIKKYKFPLTAKEWKNIRILSKNAVKIQLSKKLSGMSSGDIDLIADQITSNPKRLDDLFAGRDVLVKRALLVNSMKAGLVAGVLSTAIELVPALFQGDGDYGGIALRSGVVFGSTAVATGIGQGATLMIQRTPFLQHLAMRSALRLGLSTSTAITQSVAGGVAGFAVGPLIAYGFYFTGQLDLASANRFAIANTVGVGAGMLASVSAMGLVAAYGTASTGTAIASLSGVAATNASLAYLGGGTLAAVVWV